MANAQSPGSGGREPREPRPRRSPFRALLYWTAVVGVWALIFVVAFFFKKVGGSAVFWAAVAAQVVVLGIFFAGKVWPAHEIGYLWLNPIGCATVVVFSLALQAILPARPAYSAP